MTQLATIIQPRFLPSNLQVCISLHVFVASADGFYSDNPCFVVSEFSKKLFQSHLQKKKISYVVQVTPDVSNRIYALWLCSVHSAWAGARRHDGLADCCRLGNGCRVRGSRLAPWRSRPARVLFLFSPSDLRRKPFQPQEWCGFLKMDVQQCLKFRSRPCNVLIGSTPRISWYPTEESPCISFNGQLLDFRYFEINGTNFTPRN